MQVAKVCIVGCFAVSRFARIGLIVLALAIAVVGAGAVGMAFLPAAVTEPVVKPVTQSVELLTGDDKPETITVDFDEQPAALGISNYPLIQLGAMRYTTDSSLIDRASELLKGKPLSAGMDMHPIGQKRTTWLADAARPSSWTPRMALNYVMFRTILATRAMRGRVSTSWTAMSPMSWRATRPSSTILWVSAFRMPMNRPACPTRRLHAIVGLPVHGCSRMRCPGTPNREARVRRRSRDRDHHKGACPLCGGFRSVLICNILAAKSGPGVTDLDFRFRCLRSSRFVTVRP